MLRGAFGHALKNLACSRNKNYDCSKCQQKGSCIYTNIFEIYITNKPPPFLKGINSAPRPFVIDAFQVNENYNRGQELKFNITLFGNACKFYPYIIFSFKEASEKGYTKSLFRFTLIKVTSGSETIFDIQNNTISGTAKPVTSLPDRPASDLNKINFLTPTRFKVQDRWTMEFTFRDFVFRILKRSLEMSYFYSEKDEINWEFKPVLEMADAIKIIEKNLRWQKLNRYSGRQRKKVAISGFTGSITCNGDMENFRQLLSFAELLHVGKGAVFGLGKVRIGG